IDATLSTSQSSPSSGSQKSSVTSTISSSVISDSADAGFGNPNTANPRPKASRATRTVKKEARRARVRFIAAPPDVAAGSDGRVRPGASSHPATDHASGDEPYEP